MSRSSETKQIVLKLAKVFFPDRQVESLLKFELKLLVISIYSKVSPFEWLKVLSLKRANDLMINIGSGELRHKGWLNLDYRLSLKKNNLVCDLRRQWPLASQSAKYIFCEHVFEHFGYPDEIKHILAECYRILQPAGVLRVIVPDAERYLRAYVGNDEAFLRQVGGGVTSKICVINKMMRENGFHRYAYDYEKLKELLDECGFRDVTRSRFRESEYKELNLDLDEPERKLVSLYVEAIR